MLVRLSHPHAEAIRHEAAELGDYYFVVNAEQVPDLAAKLHGIRMPLGTVAYSVYEDLSIVGAGDGSRCGSSAHELMHLSIRQNFSDAPAWLEEGLASEIAVGLPAGPKFQFLKSWRDEVLERDASIRLSVTDLLHKRWPDYATSSNAEVQKVAALHAMAAAFIRYLAFKGELEPVYFAIRDSVRSANPGTDEQILQSALSMNLAQIDTDFDTWFKSSGAAQYLTPNAKTDAGGGRDLSLLDRLRYSRKQGRHADAKIAFCAAVPTIACEILIDRRAGFHLLRLRIAPSGLSESLPKTTRIRAAAHRMCA